jgi:SM-20-related protein
MREPFEWAELAGLFSPAAAASLAGTYPHDRFKRIAASGGEKDYEYEARNLIGMGATTVSHPERLSQAWRELGRDLLSPAYREVMSTLTGRDLRHAQLEVNVFHYGPGASLGAHRDLPEKLVTHVFYFNRTWNRGDGGCLGILRSSDPNDLAAEVEPLVGHSAVIVRSETSWHVVSRVAQGAAESRRSMTVTFYPPGAVSSMWPPGEEAELREYVSS